MSEQYIGVCRDCRTRTDLGRFYIVDYLAAREPYPWSVKDNAFMGLDELHRKTMNYAPTMARFVALALKHPGHRLEILRERGQDEDEGWEYDEEHTSTRYFLEPFVHESRRKRETPEP